MQSFVFTKLLANLKASEVLLVNSIISKLRFFNSLTILDGLFAFGNLLLVRIILGLYFFIALIVSKELCPSLPPYIHIILFISNLNYLIVLSSAFEDLLFCAPSAIQKCFPYLMTSHLPVINALDILSPTKFQLRLSFFLY